MKTRFLLPYKYKIWGWIIFVPFSILGIIGISGNLDFDFLDIEVPSLLHNGIGIFEDGSDSENFVLFKMVNNNLANEILGIMVLIGCVLLTFTKQKDEDEFIAKKRLESLLWATFVNSILLFLCLILFYDINFFNVMIFNLYSIFILFIVHFYLSMRKIKRELE